MAEVLVFCSKVSTSNRGTFGIEEINLRHPRTHAVGWSNWKIRFPVDLDRMMEHKREREAAERQEWNMIRFETGTVTRSMLLRELSMA